MVGVWEGLNLGSIPNFFLCFGMHPKIYGDYPKLIPKKGVVQFCQHHFPVRRPWVAASAGGVGWDKAVGRAGLKCFTTLHPLSFPSTPAVELLYFHGRALTVDQMVQRTDLDSRARYGGIIDGNCCPCVRVATVEVACF